MGTALAGEEITGLSLNDVRKLIEDKKLPEQILDNFNLVFGAVIALSPIVAGTAALPLLAAIEPAGALVDAGKAIIKRLTRPDAVGYIDQATRFAAANTVLTYTAFFDALRVRSSRLAESGVTASASIRAAHAAALTPGPALTPSQGNVHAADTVVIPHSLKSNDPASLARHYLYVALAQTIYESARGQNGSKEWLRLRDLLLHDVCPLAESLYQAEFLGMAVDYQPFFVWSELRHQAWTEERLRLLGQDVRSGGENAQLRFELLGSALHGLDQSLDRGFDRLARAIAELPRAGAGGPRRLESNAAKAAAALRRRYTADVDQPVIDDRYEPSGAGPRLSYPRRSDAYIPQAYRQIRYEIGKTPLERDDAWADVPLADDLGPAITRFLESPYSVTTPLLILGHPGSGKSLLTQVYAARLSDPRYTVVRVELRDSDPSVRLQKQIEDQIRKDTGYDVSFADLADNLPFSPPVVILDGYDELLQSTGKLFTDYLDQVRQFQEEQLIQGRAVRVIVTSRLTLIDRAVVPPGTTVLRLEPFDPVRAREWLVRWNEHNAAYFDQAQVKPFSIPDTPRIRELAEQPLLLLMLAIFDSVGNQLSERTDLDQTLLYDQLLRRFIERELGKEGAKFTGKSSVERAPLVEAELVRLGVAAIGMFNRQELVILRDQLDQDLAYFAPGAKRATGLYGQAESDMLLGSFFFVHESRTGLAGASRPAAFEFLHNTFGEFLTADFILRQVTENADAISEMTGRPTLEFARQQHLATLTARWFACLLYTPLHTRPNTLVLLREWAGHRLPVGEQERDAFRAALDAIVATQLRAVLTSTQPLDLAALARPAQAVGKAAAALPYEPLPVLGQAAVYTLNLILLRTYLSGPPYILDESALDAGPRPWERLVGLWRSWFTADSLDTLASRFHARRDDRGLTLWAESSSLSFTPDSALHSAFNAAAALADDLTTASTGLHVLSLNPPESEFFFAELLRRFTGDASVLLPIAELMRLRNYGAELTEDARIAFASGLSDRPMIATDFADVTDRVLHSPRQRVLGWDPPDSLDQLPLLSRYQAELVAHSRGEQDTLWLRWLLLGESQHNIRPLNLDMRWQVFLGSPAAAPVLRAALRHWNAKECAAFAAKLWERLSRHEINLYDVDTAAALSVLAWHGTGRDRTGPGRELSRRCIDIILQQCSQLRWNPLDIPLSTWDGLVDLFRAVDPGNSGPRAEFAALLDLAIGRESTDLFSGLSFVEFWIQALRIGITQYRIKALEIVILEITREHDRVSSHVRRCFLRYLRWARESGEDLLVEGILAKSGAEDSMWSRQFGVEDPDEIDLERVGQILTYQEAMDLRWFLDRWRESRSR